MDKYKYSLLATVLLIASQAKIAASKNCCAGLEPLIPAFCFDNVSPFEGPFTARCIENIPYVSFTYYTAKDRTVGQAISRIVIPSNFNATSPTVVLVHGWGGSSGLEPLTNNIIDAKGAGVIVVKWDGSSLNPNYLQSAADTLSIAKEIEIIRKVLINKFGMEQSSFRCIGHSLGGQICGRAGNYMKFGRVIGMDPAGPDFEDRLPGGRLSSDSADLVSVIHTSSSGSAPLKLGMQKPCGHVDFYPNGGENQPECQLTLRNILSDPIGALIGEFNIIFLLTEDASAKCSHGTSVRLLSESLMNKKCVTRRSCTDHTNLPGSCGPATVEPLQLIGFASAYPARGIFYLTTNDHASYCKG